MPGEPAPESMPPREVLYAFYVLLIIVLFATLVLAGVYGT